MKKKLSAVHSKGLVLFFLAWILPTPGLGSQARTGYVAENLSGFAWDLFAQLNRPDPSAFGCPTAWECWATKHYLFGTCRPDWNDPAARRRHLTSLTQEEQGLLHFMRDQGLLPDQVEKLSQTLKATETEIRLNRIAFDWIFDHRLHCLEEQQRRYKVYLCHPKCPQPTREFLEESIFVEASWIRIDSNQKDEYHHFIRESESGEVMGLVGLHVSIKSLPNWIWMTWEHIDNPQRFAYRLMEDRLQPEARRQIFANYRMCEEDLEKPCYWMNYVLNGVQTSFLDGHGRPVLLSNSVFETSNPESSCMSCHARSAIGAGDRRLNLFSQDAAGAPSPEWFDRTPLPDRPFLQLDFVNSLTDVKRCKEICPSDSHQHLEEPQK
ncbi:MAG: hypothetical protein AAGC60_23315 [Acidobacteriota bacterium]